MHKVKEFGIISVHLEFLVDTKNSNRAVGYGHGATIREDRCDPTPMDCGKNN